MVRRSAAAALAVSFFFSQSAFAQSGPAPESERQPAFTVTGGVTLASQYRFRGISLSDEEAALQGTLNLNHESGIYAGVWASTLDGFGELGGSNLELDLYAGYRRQVAAGITLDAGLLYYAYPGSSGGDFEFFEPYASVTVNRGPVTGKLGIAVAPSQDALGGNANTYVYGDLSLAIPRTPLTLTGHLGNSHGNTPLTPSGDYLDWSVGVSASWRNLTLAAAYVDTNLSATEAAAGGATRDIVDGAFVATLAASF
ncbi:MAG TPA: TorF family putative porin [Allosphingosinicella sp.]|nr:TorF family putative porin [Allosphingosinicella sp.]